MQDLLTRLFANQKLIAQTLKERKPIYSPVLDNIYTSRPTHPFSFIRVDEIAEVAGTVPIVRRGAPGVNIAPESGRATLIEPHPFKVKDTITGKDMNDLKSVGLDGVTAYVQMKIENYRNTIRRSTEALAAQSLSGVISYPMVLENGQIAGVYEVDFTNGGANPITSYTPTVLWSNTSKKVTGIVEDFTKMKAIMQDNGYGSSIKIWAGEQAYFRLLDILNSSTNPSILPTSDGAINLPGGFRVELRNEVYTLPDGTTYRPVNPNEVLMYDSSANWKLVYLAIDDIKNLVATPLYIKTWNDEDRGALMVSAESKPLPIPVIKAIVRATVL